MIQSLLQELQPAHQTSDSTSEQLLHAPDHNHVPHLESPEDPAPQLAAWVGRLKARDLSLAPQLAAIQRHLNTNDLAATTCEDAAATAAAAAGAATRHVSKHVVHLALATIQGHLHADDLAATTCIVIATIAEC
jgi:hypothetical protein